MNKNSNKLKQQMFNADQFPQISKLKTWENKREHRRKTHRCTRAAILAVLSLDIVFSESNSGTKSKIFLYIDLPNNKNSIHSAFF